MRNLALPTLFAVALTFLGPRLVGPQNHAAGAPFAYEPPEGFLPYENAKKPVTDGAKVWVEKSSMGMVESAHPVRLVLNHSSKVMRVDEADLAQLVTEMPKAFEGCAWSHRRHEMRTRSDGARVGLIEGECVHSVALGAIGLPDRQLREDKLQLMFPDDEGTSIVTASYPTEQGSQWKPLVESTIEKARGVATRVPSPPAWTLAAWALGGAVIGWFAAALGGKSRKQTREPTKEPKEQAE